MNAESFYRQFIGAYDTVFDVGSNLGERTAIFSRLAPQGHVVAIEPIDESAARILALDKRNVSLVRAALGAKPGKAKIKTWSSVPHVGTASMSEEWIERVKESGRFGDYKRWDDEREVSVMTLDEIIAWHGAPSFIKIDVEGSEAEVLEGLPRAVPALSFEFTPEYREGTERAIMRLIKIGMVRFAWSEGESFQLSEWTSSLGLMRKLDKITGNQAYGDIYARMT